MALEAVNTAFPLLQIDRVAGQIPVIDAVVRIPTKAATDSNLIAATIPT